MAELPRQSSGRRAYYVRREARTVTTYRVFAATAREAIEEARRGGGEPIDSVTDGGTFRQARRAPEEDRDA